MQHVHDDAPRHQQRHRQDVQAHFATKVYRGVSGMALPDKFWTDNEYGVKGGIEAAFMSTTKDRKVAMQYAASSGRGVVFEIQQGMIDRGADIGWLSQYPHEEEILFRHHRP